MKIIFIHLTDIHFSIKTDLNSKLHFFCQACIKDIRGVSKVYFIVSGDIANSGKKEEYDKAKAFLSTVKQLIYGEIPGIEIKFIFVPGNHDCNFEKHDNQLRRN